MASFRCSFFRFIVAMSSTPSSHGVSAPPKPQRSFTALVRGGQPGGQQQQVMSPQSPSHGSYGRPLPDRPYSVAGQYPSPDRRSFQDYSGYLSSPERRVSVDANGRPVPYHPPPYPGQPVFDNGQYNPIYDQRPASVAAVDDMSRQRIESMERQIANLTGIVQKVLVPGAQNPSGSGGRSGPTGSERGTFSCVQLG